MFHKVTLDEIIQRLEALSDEEILLAINGTTTEAAELYVRMFPEEPIFQFFLTEKRRYEASGQLRIR